MYQYWALKPLIVANLYKIYGKERAKNSDYSIKAWEDFIETKNISGRALTETDTI